MSFCLDIYTFRVLTPSSGVDRKPNKKLETCVQVKVYLGSEEVGEKGGRTENFYLEKDETKSFFESLEIIL